MTNPRFSLRSLKFILFTAALLASVQLSYSQKAENGTITGNITTSEGQPAEFATIMLGNNYGTTADARGRFSFEAPAGKYEMAIYHIAAHDTKFPVEITQGAKNDFPDIVIIKRELHVDPVVVTGQFSPQSLRNSVYKVKVIDNKQIESKGTVGIESLLGTEVGIRLVNDMELGETDLELMGMSGNNVKVLIDGIPMIDRGANKQSLNHIDISTVDRIEIVEGPMSVIYGTDALAGVVNIITKHSVARNGKSTWNISAGVHEETAGDEYEFMTGRGIHRENVQIGWAGKAGIHIDGGFTRNVSGGWNGGKTGRELMWQPRDQYMYNATAGYAGSGLDIWYRFDFLDEKLHTPLNGAEPNPQQITDRDFLTKRFTHQAQADWLISNRLRLNMAASYQDYTRRTRTTITDTGNGSHWPSTANAAQDTTTMQSIFARATATWKATPTLTFQPGVDFQWTEGKGNRIFGKPGMTDVAAYVSAEWRAARWLNIRPGVRTILNSDYDAPVAIPTLLTKFNLTDDMDLRASYAYGFRSPTLRELYFRFYNPMHLIDGNPDLKAEYSHNFTLSYTWRILRGKSLKLTSTLSGFYNDFRDRILLVRVNTDMPPRMTYNNIDKYRTVGATLENSVTWKNLTANVTASLIGRNGSAYTEMDLYKEMALPGFRYSPEVSISASYSLPKSGTDINLFYKFTGKRDEYAFNRGQSVLRGMDSYNWADLTVSQRIGKYVRLNAGVKNLFDVTTIENTLGSGGHGASGTVAMLGCGRSYFLGLAFNFNK